MATKPYVCIYMWKLMCMWGSMVGGVLGGGGKQKAGVSHHPSVLPHFATCIASIVCTGLCVSDRLSCLCAQRWGPARSPSQPVCAGERGTRGEALLTHANNGQRESEKDIQKESETNRKRNFEGIKKTGWVRTFLWSGTSESQGSYIVDSQQQSSSAAYNTHVVLCSSAALHLLYTRVNSFNSPTSSEQKWFKNAH